ncbi:uncharacterized protein METZ01_LOCUS317369, partial [marine metagenome]
VADETATANRFRHVSLVRDPASLPAHDIIIVCDLNKPQETFEILSEKFDAKSIRVPELLKISVPRNSTDNLP